MLATGRLSYLGCLSMPPRGVSDDPRPTEIQGDVEIEREEPLIAHGAGPARPRRVRRRVWLKGPR